MNRVNQQKILAVLQELSDNPPVLPYEPTLIPMLFSATRENSTSSIDDLTQLVERSQKLTSRILSIANAPIFGQGGEVTSVSRAVSILGFNEVRAIVVMMGAANSIEQDKLPAQFDSLGIWQHQLLTASIAKSLAIAINKISQSNTDLIEPDEAYAAGLLHDIGKIFLAVHAPEIWVAIQGRATEAQMRFYEAEKEYWGLHHNSIGALVLRIWQLPALLTDMIEWHHLPVQALTHRREASVLAAANILAHSELGMGDKLPQEVIALLPPDADFGYIARSVAELFESGMYKVFVQAVA